jgi:anti-sigma factor RsiW
MKDHRFIELLNLYIDRQITAGETAELEAELQANPKRQAVYRQYCQIHTATKQVYASFRASAETSATETTQTGVIELFESRRRRAHWVYYAGGMAAAACLALVIFRQNPTTETVTPVATVNAKPAAIVAVSAPAVSAATVSAHELAPVSAGLHETPATNHNYSAMLTVLREQDEERSFSNARLQAGRLQPLFDDSLFDPVRANSAQEQRVFRSHQATPAQQAEFSAFQFQR